MYELLQVALVSAIIIGLLLSVTLVVGIYASIADAVEENKRKYLVENTYYVGFRRLIGVIAKREYKSNQYKVTILVGRRTYLTLDDENEFFRSRVGEKVSVRVREHYNSAGQIFARVPVTIFHWTQPQL